MKALIIAASLVIVGAPALAGSKDGNTPGPTQGTFAGQQPRGQSVSAYAHKANDAGSNYGQSWSQTYNDGGVGTEVQGHLAQDASDGQGPSIVGYGSNK